MSEQAQVETTLGEVRPLPGLSATLTEALEVGSAISLGRHAEAGAEGQAPYAVVPQGYRVASLEEHLPAPSRKKASITLLSAAAFILYYQRQRTEHSQIYGTTEPPAFVAILDDHAFGAGWREHTATFACPLSKEWMTWTKASGVQMSQPEFAQFIEDNLADIRNPAAADMLEISRTLEAKKNVKFASHIRLDNGDVQFKYEEEIEGAASKGQLAIPQEFTLGIPVFQGATVLDAVTARLRYRIGAGGDLRMWFELVRPHKVLETAANEVWAQIEAATETTILHGTPNLGR